MNDEEKDQEEGAWRPPEVVLLEPEIPPNTGNAARLCAATRTPLHLIEPLGFSVDQREVRRAGLDYWHLVDLRVWPNLETLLEARPGAGRWWVTKRGTVPYHQAPYRPGDLLIFGKESVGLPDALLEAEPDRTLFIPMMEEGVRSLNLATAVGIVLYESLRQIGLLDERAISRGGL
jgi:tRNA (cytidine/uridine-2'-O-)-methyltransferase